VYHKELAVASFALFFAAAIVHRSPRSDCPRGSLPAYSHNDYWNTRPLHDALSLGYKGVEADVFLVDGKLQVGHERRAAARDGTLEKDYLAPLREIVARCGNLTADGEPFLLDLEIKEESKPTFDTLVAVLSRYPELFSVDSGQGPESSSRAPAIQPVLVGWYPPEFSNTTAPPLSRQARILKADGPPTDAGDRSVGLISIDYQQTIGRRWQFPGHRRRWLAAIRATKTQFPNKRIRAYHVPVNQHVYRQLLDAGVDLIGTLELAETARILAADQCCLRPDRRVNFRDGSPRVFASHGVGNWQPGRGTGLVASPDARLRRIRLRPAPLRLR
jgi:hypothetical protein